MHRFIGQALESVLRQTYQDYEIVVVDDGSTDGTRDIVSQFQSDKLVRYLYQDNRGPSAARNAGIRESRGQFIAFLDADDLWLPQKLERQMQAFETHPDVDVVYCDFNCIDDNGNLVPNNWDVGTRCMSLYEALMYGNVVAGSDSSVLVRAKCFAEVGVFDEELLACEDLDMWRRLALAHKFLFLDEVLVSIRQHQSKIQNDLDRMASAWERYLSKMKADTPQEYRHHLPEVAHNAYWHLALAFLAQRRFFRASFYLSKVASLGPRHAVTIVNDAADLATHRLRLKLAKRAKQP